MSGHWNRNAASVLQACVGVLVFYKSTRFGVCSLIALTLNSLTQKYTNYA